MQQGLKRNISSWVAWPIVIIFCAIIGLSFWRIGAQIKSNYDARAIISKPMVGEGISTITTTPTPTTSTSTTPVVDWKTYTNSTYGFTLQFGDIWTGYKVVERASTSDLNATTSIYAAIPTTDTSWTESELAKLDNYATPFVISVYTLANWDKMIAESEGGPTPTEITRNDTYVFAWSGWQACPSDWCGKNLDVSAIIASFKFN